MLSNCPQKDPCGQFVKTQNICEFERYNLRSDRVYINLLTLIPSSCKELGFLRPKNPPLSRQDNKHHDTITAHRQRHQARHCLAMPYSTMAGLGTIYCPRNAQKYATHCVKRKTTYKTQSYKTLHLVSSTWWRWFISSKPRLLPPPTPKRRGFRGWRHR